MKKQTTQLFLYREGDSIKYAVPLITTIILLATALGALMLNTMGLRETLQQNTIDYIADRIIAKGYKLIIFSAFAFGWQKLITAVSLISLALLCACGTTQTSSSQTLADYTAESVVEYINNMVAEADNIFIVGGNMEKVAISKNVHKNIAWLEIFKITLVSLIFFVLI